MTVKAGSIVFSQGDAPGPMYVVQSGEIERPGRTEAHRVGVEGRAAGRPAHAVDERVLINRDGERAGGMGDINADEEAGTGDRDARDRE